jgi:plastocyanin
MRARAGVSRIALAAALVAVVAVAGVAAYLASTPSAPSTSTRITSTTSTFAAPLNVTMTAVPFSLLISPGQTQNYSFVQVSAAGSGLGGTLTVSAFPPSGLSMVLNQTSVPFSDGIQSIPVVLKADLGLSPGNYSVTLEVSSSTGHARNQTVEVHVMPMLVTMQDLAFHPANITVAKGTRVTAEPMIDSTIGCCDPGNHDVSFTSGGNATFPILSRFESWSYTFGTDGAVDYYCTIHPFMKGQVTVTG